MKHAIDKWSGKHVDAEDASVGNAYICPECKAPVILRAGWARDAYFAHKQGTGSKDCDLYHFGISSSHGYMPYEETHANAIWQIEIGIRLANSGYPLGWGIELSIPHKDSATGEIEIDVGGRIQRVLLGVNSGPIKGVTAEPQSVPYVVTSISPTDGIVAKRLLRKCDSLLDSGATVFGEINRQRGQFAPRAKELKCGGRYILIWNSQENLDFPEELSLEPLQSKTEWQGGIVEIPIFASSECKTWLENLTKLKLYKNSHSFLPVWPPLIRRNSTKILEVTRNTPLYLHADGLSASTTNTSVVFARSGKQDVATSTNAGMRPFFKMAPNGESSIQISCRNTPDLQIEIDFDLPVEEIKYLSFPCVELCGEEKDGSYTGIPLHDEKAKEWLEKVRSGATTLVSIKAPIHIEGELSTGKNGIWGIHQKLAMYSGDRVSGGRVHLRTCVPQILKALKNDSTDIKIEFGGFGRVILLSDSSTPRRTVKQLPNALRTRIATYLAQLPGQYNQQRPKLTGSDEDLVSEILNSHPTKKSLAAHRTLVSALGDFIGEIRGDSKK